MHRIHLRGFWDATNVETGRVRFSRTFGRPRGSSNHLFVLAVDPKWRVVRTVVNGQPFAFDTVKGRGLLPVLEPRNRLLIECETPAYPGDPEVAIEIEE